MIQVRCPQCNTTLSLKQTPASGKIKCPKCAAIVNVAAAPAGTQAPAGDKQPAQRAATPAAQQARPARAPSANAGLDAIDFRSIPVPMAPASSSFFPVAGDARVYDGPIALDPLPIQKNEEDDDENHDAANKGAAGSKQIKVLSIVAAVAVLVIGGGIAAFMLMGGGASDSTPAVDVAATPGNANP